MAPDFIHSIHSLFRSPAELPAARAVVVHLLPLPHGDPRHPLHQDGAQNQADFGDPAKSAEAIPAQRANHAADGTAAAGTLSLFIAELIL